MFYIAALDVYARRSMQAMDALSVERDALARAARIASRELLQRLQLTDLQMSRFQDRVRGIDRRFCEVMARKG